jgi:hypothetical protein
VLENKLFEKSALKMPLGSVINNGVRIECENFRCLARHEFDSKVDSLLSNVSEFSGSEKSQGIKTDCRLLPNDVSSPVSVA